MKSRGPAAAAGAVPPFVRFGGVFLLLAVLVAIPFFVFGDRLEGLLHQEQLVAWFENYRSFAWLVAIGLLVLDLVLPIPNTVVMAALGVLFGPLVGGAVATLGTCLSGLVGYGLCRRFGRPLALKLVGEEDLEDGERLFARSGGWVVAASRWLPIVPEVVSCMAGLARMKFLAFLLALVCGAAPLGFTVAALGYAGADRPLLTLVVCALLPLPLWYLLRRVAATDRDVAP
jgi:uncharacterized membrane protein YdjX (TVP38/TMEM64 family)